jgi:hypothetical protein
LRRRDQGISIVLRISVLKDENVLKMDNGDDGTIMNVLKATELYTQKW